jgi:thymidylate synthase
MGGTNIPVILAEAETLPEAWEKAVIRTWSEGIEVKTEYDKPGDPPSKESTMIVSVKSPFKEPRIHRAFPGGLEDLEVYRQEVLYGIHDHWINPQEGKWSYTYHKRLFEYEMDSGMFDQISGVIDRLARCEFTRRAQAITWNVRTDIAADDPPCLQRIWCRITRAADGTAYLCMNTHWRSRDGYKASFMNMFALTDLQRMIAEEVSKARGEKVLVGGYIDISDSFHIYGAYYKDFNNFMSTVKTRAFEERTWHSEFAEGVFSETRERLKAEEKVGMAEEGK